MKQKLIDNIIQGTLRFLNNSQIAQLQKILEWEFAKIKVFECEKALQEIKNENTELVEMFFAAKRVEGCSEKSLKYYKATRIQTGSRKIFCCLLSIWYTLPSGKLIRFLASMKWLF